MNIIGQIDPSAFAAAQRLHHMQDEPTLGFPSSVSSRARGLLALKAQNWSAGGPSPERPETSGVTIVGSSVTNVGGVLSQFTTNSYALLPAAFPKATKSIEAVIKIHVPSITFIAAGLLGGLGTKDGYTPFYISAYNYYGYISTNGSSWDVVSSGVGIGQADWGRDVLLVNTWDGTNYRWKKVVDSGSPAAGRVISGGAPYSGLQMLIGNNRGSASPFPGEVDLNYCYVRIDGRLWWEGVVGAAGNVSRDYPNLH